MRTFKVLVFGFAALSASSPAMADITFCAGHDRLAEILNSKFDEHKLGMGLAGGAAMVELFVSAKGTFTLVSTDTAGLACIVGAGDSWETAAPSAQLSGL